MQQKYPDLFRQTRNYDIILICYLAASYYRSDYLGRSDMYLEEREVLKTDEAGDRDDQRPHREITTAHSILSLQHL